jgi:hypothetical protein
MALSHSPEESSSSYASRGIAAEARIVVGPSSASSPRSTPEPPDSPRLLRPAAPPWARCFQKLGEETTRRRVLEQEIGSLDALAGAADFASAAVRRALLRQESRLRRALLDHRDKAARRLAGVVPGSPAGRTAQVVGGTTPSRPRAPMVPSSERHGDSVVSPTGCNNPIAPHHLLALPAVQAHNVRPGETSVGAASREEPLDEQHPATRVRFRRRFWWWSRVSPRQAVGQADVPRSRARSPW